MRTACSLLPAIAKIGDCNRVRSFPLSLVEWPKNGGPEQFTAGRANSPGGPPQTRRPRTRIRKRHGYHSIEQCYQRFRGSSRVFPRFGNSLDGEGGARGTGGRGRGSRKRFSAGPGRPDGARRPDDGGGGPFGMRQEYVTASHLRTGGGLQRRALLRRPEYDGRAAERPLYRNGLSELCSLPAL